MLNMVNEITVNAFCHEVKFIHLVKGIITACPYCTADHRPPMVRCTIGTSTQPTSCKLASSSVVSLAQSIDESDKVNQLGRIVKFTCANEYRELQHQPENRKRTDNSQVN